MTTTTRTRWDVRRAATNLGITIVPFWGNPITTRGISTEREFGINPEIREVEFVSFHEIAHIVLGHTTNKREQEFFRTMAWNLNHVDIHEFEAHMVALSLAEILLTPGVDYDLHKEQSYIENAVDNDEDWFLAALDASREDISKAAQKILTAGLE